MKHVAPHASVFLVMLGCGAPGVPARNTSSKTAVYVPPPRAGASARSAEPSSNEEEPPVDADPGPPLIRVEVTDVPEEGEKPSDFVPAGWKLEQEVRGDLDGSGGPDAALVLVRLPLPEDALELDDTDRFRDRVLLVVLAASSNRFRRVGFSNEILGCTQCGGAFWAALEMPVELGITDEKLRIAQEYGSRVVSNVEIHLRYAPGEGRVVLVKRVDHDHDRVTGDFRTLDVDYEAGLRTRVEHVSNSTSKKVETFPRANVYLETLKLSDRP